VKILSAKLQNDFELLPQRQCRHDGDTFTSMGGIQVDDYCDGQCGYDNVVLTPAGHPDVVYLMGSFNYPLFGIDNGRAILLSTDGGATWSDMTQDSKPTHANATHPDQHAMVVNPHNPLRNGPFFCKILGAKRSKE
jgi:hypothetical protein